MYILDSQWIIFSKSITFRRWLPNTNSVGQQYFIKQISIIDYAEMVTFPLVNDRNKESKLKKVMRPRAGKWNSKQMI